MAAPFAKTSFGAGEISPSVWGRTDLAKYHAGCSTLRNFFVNYRGGASSRAGTAFVGQCKQRPPAAPPRDIRFQFNINQGYALEFGDNYMRVKSDGAYVTEAPIAITGASQADPCVLTIANSWAAGDWIFVTGVAGMTQLNGKTFIVSAATGTSVTLSDLFDNPINATGWGAYVSGGTAARIFTLATPWAAVDLPWLKYAQDADVMSLCCVNQDTGTDYPPYDLARITASDWTLTETTFAASIAAPATLSGASQATGTWNFDYVMTAVSAATGEESVPSPVAAVTGAANPSIQANTITLSGAAVAGAAGYNFYRAEPSLSAIPAGVLFGYIGSSTTPSFVDSNVVADFSQTPPTHQNPFSGTGNYPAGVAYFQQRRFYFFTKNAPNTYFASKPGAYANMDSSAVSEADDAIIGTPWAQQVNGIQAMVPMQSGLVILTGAGAWQLTGGGASSFNLVGITPADQQATPQAYNGCSATVPTLTVNYDILYVQAKGSIVRDLAYNFFVNIYTGTDITILSNHLFTGYQISQWDYAEEPFKVVWAVRNDGILLSLTYLKEQEIYGWARHDTNGLFVSACVVTEPPVDALYLITKRYVPGANNGAGAWVYYSERMDNHIWSAAEDAWCVDAGLTYGRNTPDAILTPAAASGGANITATKIIAGGANYVAPVAVAVDPTGAGTGATFAVTVTGGAVTAVTPLTAGENYSALTRITISDAAGSGAVVDPVITNIVAFLASANVFADTAGAGAPGDVIRCGGGIATVTSFVSSTEVLANITTPITAVTQDGGGVPVPQAAGAWSIVNPVTVVSGLDHLDGMTVSILADGGVMPQQVVENGAVTLPAAASAITVGLPFQAQLQTLYLDVPGMNPTVAGRRKQIPSLTVRTEASRGIKVGVNQPDASAQPGGANVPWSGMVQIPEMSPLILPGQPIPLITGDNYMHLPSDWNTAGQVAIQIDDPVPANILMLVAEIELGDTPSA